jgi:hypothetical protein
MDQPTMERNMNRIYFGCLCLTVSVCLSGAAWLAWKAYEMANT